MVKKLDDFSVYIAPGEASSPDYVQFNELCKKHQLKGIPNWVGTGGYYGVKNKIIKYNHSMPWGTIFKNVYSFKTFLEYDPVGKAKPLENVPSGLIIVRTEDMGGTKMLTSKQERGALMKTTRANTNFTAYYGNEIKGSGDANIHANRWRVATPAEQDAYNNGIRNILHMVQGEPPQLEGDYLEPVIT